MPTKVGDEPRREALGWSRGRMTKIHLAADTRCRPISRVTTVSHPRDSLAFESVMAGIRIRRRSRTRLTPVLGDKALLQPRDPLLPAATPDQDHHPRAGQSASQPPPSRNQRPTADTVRRRDARRRALHEPAHGPPRGGKPLRQNETTCIAELSTSHRSESGSASPSHDPRDRLWPTRSACGIRSLQARPLAWSSWNKSGREAINRSALSPVPGELPVTQRAGPIARPLQSLFATG